MFFFQYAVCKRGWRISRERFEILKCILPNHTRAWQISCCVEDECVVSHSELSSWFSYAAKSQMVRDTFTERVNIQYFADTLVLIGALFEFHDTHINCSFSHIWRSSYHISDVCVNIFTHNYYKLKYLLPATTVNVNMTLSQSAFIS